MRRGDVTTPWWYPAKTDGGEMREDRLVFPIPPGTHWRDVLPTVLPETIDATAADADGATDGTATASDGLVLAEATDGVPSSGDGAGEGAAGRIAPSPASTGRKRGRARATAGMLTTAAVADLPMTTEQHAAITADRASARERIRERVRLNPPKPVRPAHVPRGGLWAAPDYEDYQPTEAEIDAEVAAIAATRIKAVKKAAAKVVRKVDPRLIDRARELRDRWTEEVAAGRWLAPPAGKYALTRDPATAGRPTAALPTTAPAVPALPMLDAAADAMAIAA